jgi:hypothetical protein
MTLTTIRFSQSNVEDHEMISVSADTGLEATIFKAQAPFSTDTDLHETAANTGISTEPEAEGLTVNDISFYDTDKENAERTLEILAAELPFGEDTTDEFGEQTDNWEGASAVLEEELTGVDPEVYDDQGYVIYRNPLPPPAEETDMRLHPRALRELFSEPVSVRAKYVAYFRRRTGRNLSSFLFSVVSCLFGSCLVTSVGIGLNTPLLAHGSPFKTG